MSEHAGRTEEHHADLAVVGAGPIGLELAGAASRLGIRTIVFDAGQVGQTIYDWPEETRYFSSPERMAVAGIPMQTTHQQLGTREEYLAYLRSVVEILDLDVRVYEAVTAVHPVSADTPGAGGTPPAEPEPAAQTAAPAGFVVETRRSFNHTDTRSYRVRKVVIATGDMARPRKLGIPGEELPHVTHYFDNPHRYFRQRLLVVGGRNSAVEAAIRSWRAGADVALSYRRAELDREHIYSRLHLEINLLIRKGRVHFYPETEPLEMRPGVTVLAGVRSREYQDGDEIRDVFETTEARSEIPADFVYLATGYRADTSLLEAAGVAFDSTGTAPELDEETMESSVPGIYVAGTAIGGNTAGYKVFVGTCHDQALRILSHAFGVRDRERIVTGTVAGRNYPFSRKDIEPE